jgi:hypothetical protein
METEASLQCLQEPSTGPYSDSDESSPHPPPRFPKVNFNIIFHLRLHLSGNSSFQVFEPNYNTSSSSLPCVLQVLSIKSSLIWSP